MNEIIPAWLGLSHDVSICWGITLLHFLWQGAVIGLLALVASRLLRSQSASMRYWLNAVALLACPICVACTFAVVDVPESWQVNSNQQSHGSLDSGGIPIQASSTDDLVDIPYPKLDPPEVVSNADAASASFDAAFNTPVITPVVIDTTTSTRTEWMPIVARWITILYAVGMVYFLFRLAIALRGGHRLRAISNPVSDSALLELIRTQAQRIGLKLVPVVAYCERVAVPTVIGVLCPMILLPTTLTAGLTTDELSAILSHELAHIRRYDLWMNLLQRIIESLLFFHPVVWLLSRCLSAEREICCDDLVIRSGHQPMNYAGALLRMAELCAGISPQNSLSLAATSGGTSLLEYRVLRLIHKSPSTRLSLDRKGLFVLVSGLIATLGIVLSPSKPQQAATEGVANTANAVTNPDPVPAPQAAEENPDEPEEPRTESISISGRVLDVNQTPLAGVRVFVVSSQHGAFRNLAETVSKEDGSYEFNNVKLPIILDEMFGRWESVGAFEVFAISDAYGFTWRTSRHFLPDSKPSRSTMINGSIEAQIETKFPAPDSPAKFFSGDDIEMDLVFDEPAKMRLRAVDDEGQPIQNARVRLWNADPIPGFVRERFRSQIRGRSMGFKTLYDPRLMPKELVARTTDSDGWFEYSAMPLNCEFGIEVNPEGFARRMIHATTGENYKSEHQVLYRNGDEVVFPRTAEVTVSVKFADTQQPAPRVWVHGGAWHGSGSQHGSTSDAGEIVLNLPPGECAFQVLPEYKTAYVFIDDDSLRCMVEKGKKNRFEILLQRAAEVEVRVLDAETGQPVAGADLWVLHGDRSERRTHDWRSFEQPNIVRQGPRKSDENGIIQTYFVPGKYSIGLCDYFTPPGYEPTAIADALPVEFKAGEKQVVTLKLKRIESQAAVPN
ncbi:MAG: M48 family metalloprotease [Planctomycetaceae bacterium]|nr:M48 family metalloprotease [Planctomycetaceae bacterium]